MQNTKYLAAMLALSTLAGATAASANPSMMDAPVHPAPGPSYVPFTPHYFDPNHSEHDFSYWQAKHDEEKQARMAQEHDLAVRRAEADRLARAEMLEQQRMEQQRRMEPAR